MPRNDAGPPSTAPDEKPVLLGFLNYLRDAITAKVSGIPEPQVRTAGVPSGTNLLGLVKHLACVERYYFFGERITSLRRTMQPTAKDTVASVLADYRQTITRADELIAACDDLAKPLRGGGPSLRWVLVHLIEETARHAGHADILREHLDGATGR
ncbi:DinB family protein [Dactylosporangium sp. NPDC000521]|uniref:DinB family protein n=1 Tax=Dactylosporangium sp. NPDC000521 TaxID=3363975 RepID=UPI00367B5CC3